LTLFLALGLALIGFALAAGWEVWKSRKVNR
jgi:hypothetical protein